jgi:hypothetical protein
MEGFRAASLIALASTLIVGNACGDSDPGGPGDPASVVSVDIQLLPLNLSLHPGDSIRLVATPKDRAGRAVPGRTVTWSTDDAEIATVSGAGLVKVHTRGDGDVKITASVDGVSASVTLDIWGWHLETQPGIVRLRQRALVGAESGGSLQGLPRVTMECFTERGILDLFVGFIFATDGSGRIEYRFNGEQTVAQVWSVGKRGPGALLYPGDDFSFAQSMAQKDTLFVSVHKINGNKSSATFVMRGLSELLAQLVEQCGLE